MTFSPNHEISMDSIRKFQRSINLLQYVPLEFLYAVWIGIMVSYDYIQSRQVSRSEVQ